MHKLVDDLICQRILQRCGFVQKFSDVRVNYAQKGGRKHHMLAAHIAIKTATFDKYQKFHLFVGRNMGTIIMLVSS